MPDRPMATVRPVEEGEATGRVAAIFADIKATKQIDFVPNFWRVLATSPDQLELIWTRLKALMHPEAAGRTSPLDAKTREIIALAVSAPSPDDIARRLREHEPPVLARIDDGRVLLDARTVLEGEDDAVVGALRAALSE